MNNATLNSTTLDGLGGTLNQASADLGCSIIVSDYKWLSPALKTKQQQQALRPYYTCQIIDDSFVPNQIFSSPSQPKQGSAVVAPDGNILSAGIDSLNNISFWKGDYTSISVPATHIFTSGSGVVNSKNHIAIQVSDYIHGTYSIDVYLFGNFTNANLSGFLSVINYHSDDGGTTWSSSVTTHNTLTPYNALANIWIAAGKPYQANNGNIIRTFFYIDPDGSVFDIAYQEYLGVSGGFENPVRWSKKDINTRDWILNSLDVALVDGNWHIAFSGYHTYYEPTNQNGSILNYGIYTTEIISFQNDALLDVWSPANPVITSVSSSPQNANTFTFPQLMYDEIDELLYIIFRGQTVASISDISSNSSVSLSDNFYISKSVDLKNFSYPNPVIFTDGTNFIDTNANSIVRVGQLFYILGNGKLWNYILNNIVADVSSDIIQYSVQDTQQSASTINIGIGNQNNQWRGASPTKNGYQAIAANKKINLMQGYYTSDLIAEVAPKNIFYIDDIQANVTNTRNDFMLAARDLYKPLKVLQTKSAFNYTGIKKYIDIFDGTTISNYNISSGSWTEDSVANTLNQSDITVETLAVFSQYQQTKANTMFTVATQLPDPTQSGSAVRIYFYYLDGNNFMRLDIANNSSGSNYSWDITQNVAGSLTTLQSGTFATGTTNFFPFMFVRQSFGLCQIYLGDDTSDGQAIGAFNTMTPIGTEVDFTLNFSGLGSVGFGGIGSALTFKNFRYIEFDISQDIQELIQTIATKAGIFDYKLPTIFRDFFYDDTGFSGTYSLPNRILTIPNSQVVMKYASFFENADLRFNAQITPIIPTDPYYLDFIFRNPILVSTDNNYFVRINNDGTGYITVSLYATFGGVQYLLSSTGGSSGANNIRFDLTQEHEYRIIYFNQYFFVMIDSEVVLGWFDNNITNTEPGGYMGFRTSSNSYAEIKSFISIDLFTQIENFSINPGDDLESSIESLLTTIRSYMFSDNWGRLKVIVLHANDPSGYTYEDQLILQAVDNSDKEYYNEVIVVGANGITATSQDAASIATNGIVRSYVVNDNSITTFTDATARANAELINANKFNNQYSPKQVNNVGSEIYDVIHVINTGANSSNVDQVVRNYSQEIDAGGDNNISYWISLGTGKE